MIKDRNNLWNILNGKACNERLDTTRNGIWKQACELFLLLIELARKTLIDFGVRVKSRNILDWMKRIHLSARKLYCIYQQEHFGSRR